MRALKSLFKTNFLMTMTMRLEPKKKEALLALCDVIISSQICGSKLQKVRCVFAQAFCS